MDFSLKNLCWDRNQINFISNISVQFVLWLVSSFKKLVWSTADFTNSIGEKKFLAGLPGVRSLENLYGLKGGEYASFRECQGDATNRTKLNKLNLVLFKGGANFATNLIFF